MDGVEIGSIGKLNDEITRTYKFRQSVFVCEIDLTTALSIKESPVGYSPLSIYPGISYDVSLVAKRRVSYADIRNLIAGLGFELCRDISFVDLYEGKGLTADERSITIRLDYASDERTLVEAEVDEVHRRIINELEEKLAVKQRA